MKTLGCLVLVICLLSLSSCTLFNAPGKVIIWAEPRFGVSPLFVDFDGSGCSDPDGICKYEWSFGARGVKARHRFTAGEHTTVLRITDTLGDCSQAEITIHVRPDPSGRWVGALVGSSGVTLPLELHLDWDGASLTGTVFFGVVLPFIGLPIVESEVDYNRIYIRAENLVQLLGWVELSLELECVPGDFLSSDAHTGAETFSWVVVRQ